MVALTKEGNEKSNPQGLMSNTSKSDLDLKHFLFFQVKNNGKIIFDTWTACGKTGLKTALAHRGEFK